MIASNSQEFALTQTYQTLAPYVSTTRGIDVSDTMVEKYNHATRKQGLSEQQMHAVRGDLVGPEDEIPKALKEADFYDFDVIVMSMALHHVEDPQLMMMKLWRDSRTEVHFSLLMGLQPQKYLKCTVTIMRMMDLTKWDISKTCRGLSRR